MTNTRFCKAAWVALGLVLLAFGQSPGPNPGDGGPATGDWLTFGHDPQRSGWSRDEKTFRRENASQLRLVWQAALPNEAHVLTGLTAPLVVRQVETERGVRDLVIVAGSADRLFALDARDGDLVWSVEFTTKEKPRRPMHWLCPNALNATPAIDLSGKRVWAVASDGRLYSLSLSNGKQLQAPLRFVPPFSKMWSLNYVGGAVYTTLSQDCNEARSAVAAIAPDTPGHPVTMVATSQACAGGFCGAGVWGRAGAAADFQGNMYAATGDAPFDSSANQFGNSVLRLSPGLKEVTDFYTPPNWRYLEKLDLDLGNTTPVVFRWRDQTLVAVGGKEGRLYLMNGASMGGTDHHSALHVSPVYSNEQQVLQQKGIWGALSTWTDPAGQVWIYVPTWGAPVPGQDRFFGHSYGEAPSGSVMAFKVVASTDGRATLEPVWRSRDIAVPEPVAIAGGVVFALGSGENTLRVFDDDIRRDIGNAAVVANSKHAILYALDAMTGKEIWNSGDSITDWTHFSGLAVGAGKVFVTTHGGDVYAFGLTDYVGRKSYRKDERKPVSSVTPPQPTRPAEFNQARAAGSPGDRAVVSLYRQHCAQCHGLSGRGDAVTHTPEFTSSEWQAGRNDAVIRQAVKDGKAGGMPAFGERLSKAELDALVRYIRSFGRAPERQN